ncbi:hypothetical protein FVEN_g12834 [Fusarium venenatum]|nr:hypothetical protein FVEN_g12834 [Fusarium venenatum]
MLIRLQTFYLLEPAATEDFLVELSEFDLSLT